MKLVKFWALKNTVFLTFQVPHAKVLVLIYMQLSGDPSPPLPRSILTVPWLEMGGKVNLVCEKTGYCANIDFHCKPFYGGKKHRVTADIL